MNSFVGRIGLFLALPVVGLLLLAASTAVAQLPYFHSTFGLAWAPVPGTQTAERSDHNFWVLTPLRGRHLGLNKPKPGVMSLLDNDGKLLSSVSWTMPNTDPVMFTGMDVTHDDGFVVVGRVDSAKHCILMRADHTGQLQWHHTFRFGGYNGTKPRVVELSTHEIVVAVDAYLPTGGGQGVVGLLVMLFDQQGNLQWQKSMLPPYGHTLEVLGVEEASNGQIVVGTSEFENRLFPGNPNPQPLIHIGATWLNRQGNVQQRKAYLDASPYWFSPVFPLGFEPANMAVAQNNELLFTGRNTVSAKPFMMKIDAGGKVLWANSYRDFQYIGPVTEDQHHQQIYSVAELLAPVGSPPHAQYTRTYVVSQFDPHGTPNWSRNVRTAHALITVDFEGSDIDVTSDGRVLASGIAEPPIVHTAHTHVLAIDPNPQHAEARCGGWPMNARSKDPLVVSVTTFEVRETDESVQLGTVNITPDAPGFRELGYCNRNTE